MSAIFRLFIHPMGGAHVLIEDDNGRALVDMMIEDFKRQYDQLQEDVNLANTNVAFLNDDNQMEDGDGNIYVRRRKKA